MVTLTLIHFSYYRTIGNNAFDLALVLLYYFFCGNTANDPVLMVSRSNGNSDVDPAFVEDLRVAPQ